MAASICVGCGITFETPGADPAPFCLECEVKADRAYGGKKRSSYVWLFALLLIVLATGCFFTLVADVDPSPAGATVEGR